MSEIYLLLGSSSSFVFFFLFLSVLSFLLRLWGWERWLFDSTFWLWTDLDDCCLLAAFVFLFQGRLELQTITFRICFAEWFPPVFFGRFFCFRCFRVLFCSCLNGVSVRVFCRPFRAWCFPFGVGWGVLGVSFFSPPFPPPLACLLLLASALASRCVRKPGGSARNGPDPPQPSV